MRKLKIEDFLEVIEKTKPSTSNATIEEFRKWKNEHHRGK